MGAGSGAAAMLLLAAAMAARPHQGTAEDWVECGQARVQHTLYVTGSARWALPL